MSVKEEIQETDHRRPGKSQFSHQYSPGLVGRLSSRGRDEMPGG